VRNSEDPGDLLCDDGKEPIWRRLARDKGRDPPQGGLFGGEFPSAFFRAPEPLGRGSGHSVASRALAEELSLPSTKWHGYGDGPVAVR
jgi:hypothetical protein